MCDWGLLLGDGCACRTAICILRVGVCGKGLRPVLVALRGGESTTSPALLVPVLRLVLVLVGVGLVCRVGARWALGTRCGCGCGGALLKVARDDTHALGKNRVAHNFAVAKEEVDVKGLADALLLRDNNGVQDPIALQVVDHASNARGGHGANHAGGHVESFCGKLLAEVVTELDGIGVR